VRNYLISNLSEIEFRPDRGELFENFVFTQLLKKANPLTKINFWRTKAKREIDFIWRQENNLIALEVKWNSGSINNLKKFKEIYPAADIFLVSMLRKFDKNEKVLPGYLV